MSSTTAITSQPYDIASIENLNKQIQNEIPKAPCSCVCCGGRTWDALDSTMCCLQIAPVAGFVATFFAGQPLLAIAFGISSCGNCVAHGLVRKYGNLSRIVQKLGDSEGALSKTLQKMQKTILGLQEANTTLATTSEAVEAAATSLGIDQKEIGTLIVGLRREVEDQTKIANELTSKNHELDLRVKQLDKLMETFKNQAQDFQKQNENLKAAVIHVSASIDKLDSLDGTISSNIKSIDSVFDEDIADFARLIASAQSESQNISSVLFKQNQELSEQVTNLQASVLKLQQALSSVDNSCPINLMKELEESKLALGAMKWQFSQLQKTLEEKQAWIAEQDVMLENLKKDLETFKTDQATVADGLSPLAKDIASIRRNQQQRAEELHKQNELLEEELQNLFRENESTI